MKYVSNHEKRFKRKTMSPATECEIGCRPRWVTKWKKEGNRISVWFPVSSSPRFLSFVHEEVESPLRLKKPSLTMPLFVLFRLRSKWEFEEKKGSDHKAHKENEEEKTSGLRKKSFIAQMKSFFFCFHFSPEKYFTRVWCVCYKEYEWERKNFCALLFCPYLLPEHHLHIFSLEVGWHFWQMSNWESDSHGPENVQKKDTDHHLVHTWRPRDTFLLSPHVWYMW